MFLKNVENIVCFPFSRNNNYDNKKKTENSVGATKFFFPLWSHNEGEYYNKLNGFPFNNSSSPGLSSQFLSGVKLA